MAKAIEKRGKMYIKEIIKYNEDEPSAGAEVIVSDGKFDLLCYAYSSEHNVGDTNFTLSTFCDNDIMTSDEREYKIQQLEDGYYKLQGKLITIDKDNGTVQIGSIIIHDLRCIPKDIKVGEFIEFTVRRLDIE